MVNTTVMYDGQQIQIHLPDNPSLQTIYQCLHNQMPRNFDFRTHIIQLFDPTIGEFFDLNDDGLKSWLCLPLKEKNHMRLQIIRAGIEYDQTNGHEQQSNENMSEVFQKIERDIETLFHAIESKGFLGVITFIYSPIQIFKRLPMEFDKILNQQWRNIININRRKLSRQNLRCKIMQKFQLRISNDRCAIQQKIFDLRINQQ